MHLSVWKDGLKFMTFDISTKIPHSSGVAFDFSDFEPITMPMLANKAGAIDKKTYFPGFLTLWQLPVCHAFHFSVGITFCLVTSRFQVEISRYCESQAPKLGISLWITIKMTAMMRLLLLSTVYQNVFAGNLNGPELKAAFEAGHRSSGKRRKRLEIEMKKWKNQLYDQIMFGDVMQDFFSSRFFFFNPLYVYDMMFQNDRSTIFLSVQWYTCRGTFFGTLAKMWSV